MTLMMKNIAGHTRGNKYAKNLMVGGTHHVDAIIAQRNVNLLGTMKWRNCEKLRWHKARGTLTGQVRMTLRRLEWEEIGPWLWEHEGLEAQINMQEFALALVQLSFL